MSNAMRFGKRSLAGVAAGALALGMLTIASAPAASAAPSVKPKASLTGTVSPVRVTFTGSPSTSTLNTVPFAALSWTSSAALVAADTIDVQLTVAPSSSAILGIAVPSNVGTSTGTISGTAFANAFANETLASGITNTPLTGISGSFAIGDTARIGLAASQAGTYAGTITSNSSSCATASGTITGGGVCDVVSFSFTTTGAPASMTLTPASQSITQSGVTTLTATLRDSAGNVTQPVLADVVTVAAPGAASFSPSSIPMVATAPFSSSGAANSLWDGTATISYTASASPGTYSVTATPTGTLPAGGVTTQSAAVSVSGSAPATSAVSTMAVSVPANAANNPNGTDVPPTATAQVPAGTNSVTVTFSVSPAPAAGTTYRFGAVAVAPATGTINGATAAVATSAASGNVDTALAAAPAAAFVNASTNASGVGTATFSLGGALVGVGSQIVITQVQSNNTRVTSGGVLTVTQATPTVSATLSTTTPTGNIVQALGTPTPVTATVVDQFEDPVANATVRVYRGGYTGTLLGSGVTNATGNVTVNVSNLASLAAGGSETYYFTVTPFGATTITNVAETLTILYTATGAVTSMVVSVTGGATSPILNTTTSIPTLPYINVPNTGIVTGTATGVYTVATGAGTAGGNYVQFNAAPSPANMVTVTVPTGAKVSATRPGTTTLWSGGAQSVVVASSQAVYVWATKTGTIDVTFTSGAITTTAKVQVATPTSAAYNIAVSPTSRTIEAGAFSSVTMTVTDVFGNPVPGVTGSANSGVLVSATGEVLLGGLNSSNFAGTGADGTTTITLIAGRPGAGKVTFSPAGGTTNTALAWALGFTKPVGAPDPVKSAEVNVIITTDADKSISISGTRGTVSGKSGIIIDGVTDGIENGKTVTPFIRFPGETTFTAGSARPAISGDEFTWQRKTGKRVTVYVELSDDASVRSNRVTIQAS